MTQPKDIVTFEELALQCLGAEALIAVTPHRFRLPHGT
jgi:hypothetical protein